MSPDSTLSSPHPGHLCRPIRLAGGLEEPSHSGLQGASWDGRNRSRYHEAGAGLQPVTRLLGIHPRLRAHVDHLLCLLERKRQTPRHLRSPFPCLVVPPRLLALLALPLRMRRMIPGGSGIPIPPEIIRLKVAGLASQTAGSSSS